MVNVKPNVRACFNEATDILRFSTEAYVVATALDFLRYDSFEHLPDTINDAQQKLDSVADYIVDMCYMPPDVTNILNANTNQKEEFPYCSCHADTGEEVILCDNKKCTFGQWFHLSCHQISQEEIESPLWFCSSKCKAKHFSSSPTATDNCDHVYEYSRALLWRGLGEMVRHRSLRENDGNKIIRNWRFDMTDFFQYNHTKYFLAGHRLLSDTNGALSNRLAHQLVWNRTVNVRGGPDHNIEMDLQMEFYNRQFKGTCYKVTFFGIGFNVFFITFQVISGQCLLVT